MRTYPAILLVLGLLAAGCGADGLSPHGSITRSPMAASPQLPASFNDRVRTLAAAAPVAVYDSMLRDRVRIVALSDDPHICAHLRAGEGLADSSTVFALMAGAAADSYKAGATLKDVINAAMGFSRLGPVATVTAQLLDSSCRLVKPVEASDTREVATAGQVQFHKDVDAGAAGRGQFELTLRDEAAPVRGEYVASACPGLLNAIVALMPVAQAEEEQASALRCVNP